MVGPHPPRDGCGPVFDLSDPAMRLYLLPAAPCCSCSTTLLMLKLPVFWLGGNSLNVARNCADDGLRRHEDKRVADQPVPIRVRRDVGPFVGVHPQIEDLRQPQLSERFGPNPHRALGALFGKNKLPVVVAQGHQVALVAEVEELLARIFRGLAGQVEAAGCSRRDAP